MACTSPSVQAAADKTVAAKAQIDKLQALLQGQENADKATFFDAIKRHLTDADVTDARELSYSSDMKMEYSSEFSLDRIAAVVTKALQALAKAMDPISPAPATSPAAIAAYADVVNAVAEAAKSSSMAAGSLSFSMNRLSPGMFAFLYAKSISITANDTYGAEAVTATAIYHRFMQSIDDVKNQAEFGAAVIDAKNLLHMKTIQAALTDDLAAGKISIDDWTRKDEAFSVAVQRIADRLDAAKFDTTKRFTLTVRAGFGAPIQHSFATGSPETQELVRAAIQRLSAKGDAYKAVIDKSKARLAANYY